MLKCFSWPFPASVSPSGKQWGVIMLASFDLCCYNFLYSTGVHAPVSGVSLETKLPGRFKMNFTASWQFWLSAHAPDLLVQQSVIEQVGCSWEAPWWKSKDAPQDESRGGESRDHQ